VVELRSSHPKTVTHCFLNCLRNNNNLISHFLALAGIYSPILGCRNQQDYYYYYYYYYCHLLRLTGQKIRYICFFFIYLSN
jgi:hypothetical protein